MKKTAPARTQVITLSTAAAVAHLALACFLVDPGPERPAGFGETAADPSGDSAEDATASDTAEDAPEDAAGVLDTNAPDSDPGQDTATPIDTALPDLASDPEQDDTSDDDMPDVDISDSTVSDFDLSDPDIPEDSTPDAAIDLEVSECGVEGEPCSCDGEGAAVWECGEDAELVCADGNQTRDDAVPLGSFNEGESTFVTSWIDSATDVDWYRVSVNDLDGPVMAFEAVRSNFDPTAEVELCLFYRYLEARNIAPYRCLIGSCKVYYGEFDAITDGTCIASPVFDRETDLYGCCSSTVSVALTDIEEPDSDDSGVVYVMIRTPINELSLECAEYSIQFRL